MIAEACGEDAELTASGPAALGEWRASTFELRLKKWMSGKKGRKNPEDVKKQRGAVKRRCTQERGKGSGRVRGLRLQSAAHGRRRPPSRSLVLALLLRVALLLRLVLLRIQSLPTETKTKTKQKAPTSKSH